jgi:hypothetical protein
MPTPPTLVERALQRPRSSLVVVLIAVPMMSAMTLRLPRPESTRS